MTVTTALNDLLAIKSEIKAAIEYCGVEVDNRPLSSYPDLIRSIIPDGGEKQVE